MNFSSLTSESFDVELAGSEQIVRGSIVISINGISTAGATFTETMNQLRFCPRPMTLSFLVPPPDDDVAPATRDDEDDNDNLTTSSGCSRFSTDERDLNYSGSGSYRWIDKVRAAFLEMMFVIFSGGIKVQQSFADRMMSSFGSFKKKSNSTRSTMHNNPSSPRNGTKRAIKLNADYRTFLPRPTDDHAKNQKARKLMKKKIVQAHPDNMKKFMAVFVETQAFTNFIDDASQLRFQGGGGFSSGGGGDEYSREAGIEILNQVLQTADIEEGMLLDAICRLGSPAPMQVRLCVFLLLLMFDVHILTRF